MPRTTTLDTPGCPPLRALTFDVLGLIKAIEAKGAARGPAKVVERWGEPDSLKCVLAACSVDRESDPVVGVARKNGYVEVLSSVNGDLQGSVANVSSEDGAIAGLHLFRKEKLETSSRSCTFLTCTSRGQASIQSIELFESQVDNASDLDRTTWSICGSGDIMCLKVDKNENFAMFGGKGVEMNMWDLNSKTKIWTAKSPPKNSLGIFTPTWITSTTFLSNNDHRKFVSGTNDHQVRLYDISAQRRPVMSVDFGETPIKAVAEDLDGHRVYIGNGSGDLASFDIRTGKLLGRFLGKCAGSIRSIVRHPELHVIASCGLDSYLRIWDTESRQLLSAVFLKQHLTGVVFDSYFTNQGSVTDLPTEERALSDISHRNNDGGMSAKRKWSKPRRDGRKYKKRNMESNQ